MDRIVGTQDGGSVWMVLIVEDDGKITDLEMPNSGEDELKRMKRSYIGKHRITVMGRNSFGIRWGMEDGR